MIVLSRGALTLSQLQGRTFDLLSATSITFGGKTNPSNAYVQSFFNLNALKGISFKFIDTFQNGNLIDVSLGFGNIIPTQVPEPATLAIMLLGVPMLVMTSRRKQANGSASIAA